MPQGELREELSMWRWTHPEKQRYYQADLVLDLFGDWTLVKTWGGLGTRRGSYSITGVSSYKDGLLKIDVLVDNREKRGYVPVDSFTGWMSRVENKPDLPPEKLVQRKNIPETEFVLE